MSDMAFPTAMETRVHDLVGAVGVVDIDVDNAVAVEEQGFAE